MTRIYDIRIQQTIDTLNQLIDEGIKKIGLLIRHSERFFTKDPDMEAFMGLTDSGKALALDFGALLRAKPSPCLYSSFMGRCIETAYLIDKGFTRKNRIDLDHTCVDKMLSPFYVKQIEPVVRQVKKEGNHDFLRNWFDNRVDDRIIETPEKTSALINEFMIEKFTHLKENQMAICVSHDWNIFAVKEVELGLKHETSGDIGYLDGVFYFEKEERTYITNYQTDPVGI